MKKLKGALALLLIICMGALLVSCSGFAGEEVPDGMHKVSLDGEPFILYVPVSWTDNTSSGVSSAFFVALDKVTVSARYVTSEKTLEEYVAYASELLAKELPDFRDFKSEASLLGGENAIKTQFLYKEEELDKTFISLQYYVKFGGDVIILSFYTPEERFETNTEHFEQITNEFVLCEKKAVDNPVVTDKNTPDGMKIASKDYLEYRLYVPTEWVADPEARISEAYYPTSSRPNVLASSYSPDEETELVDYIDTCLEEYEKSISGYSLISREEDTLAGREAIRISFDAKYGETDVRALQVVTRYNGSFYSITYTALASEYDTYLGDAKRIIDAFIFR